MARLEPITYDRLAGRRAAFSNDMQSMAERKERRSQTLKVFVDLIWLLHPERDTGANSAGSYLARRAMASGVLLLFLLSPNTPSDISLH
jgi:hypothetical protein